MKSLIKRFLSKAVRNDRVWSFLDATLLQAARFVEWERQKGLPDPMEVERLRVIHEKFSDLTVRHGPFAGLRFPQAIAATGSLLPKLAGCYESELHPIIELICRSDYEQTLNIGAGEGYYAVGLALRMPQVKVLAWDTSAEARTQCQSLASFNGVQDRMQCESACTAQTLKEFPFTGRSLVLCDCEGFEQQLFDRSSVQALKNHDVLIEVHDFIDMNISTNLRHAFADTHQLQVIPSIGDIKRAIECDYPELSTFSNLQRKQLISEDRNHDMEWFWFRSNT